MGGLLVDIALLAVIAAFAWGGYLLGPVSTTIRLVAALAGAALAVLLREPMRHLLERVTPMHGDGAALSGMALVAVVGFGVVSQLLVYFAAWLPADVERERRRRMLGVVPGALAGLGWAFVMVSMLVLLPRDTTLVRAAVQSGSGGLTIDHATGVLRWVNRGFPSFTETLPKGPLGAVVGDLRGQLPLHGTGTGRPVSNDAVQLLANVNQFRFDSKAAELSGNAHAADAAARHARAMLQRHALAAELPGTASLHERVVSALGSQADRYTEHAEIVVWAHGEANAFAALEQGERTQNLLRDPRFTEIGIAVLDDGFFNGRFYVVALIGPRTPTKTSGATNAPHPGPATPPPAGGAASGA